MTTNQNKEKEMTNEEILKKAIEKSIENGFIYKMNIETIHYDSVQKIVYKLLNTKHLNDIIFSHDFAKAFWGEDKDEIRVHYLSPKPRYIPTLRDERIDYIKSWQFHLQQMVISDDPIKYLEQFI